MGRESRCSSAQDYVSYFSIIVCDLGADKITVISEMIKLRNTAAFSRSSLVIWTAKHSAHLLVSKLQDIWAYQPILYDA